MFPRFSSQLLDKSWSDMVRQAIEVQIEHMEALVPLQASLLELVLVDAGKLNAGHLGMYDVAQGKWMRVAAGFERRIIGWSDAVLGDRLVDDSILGTVRHEFGHHLWYRHYCLRRHWNDIYRAKGLGHWFRQNISLYAGKNREEAWCECFSAHIAGVDLPERLNEAVANILLSCTE